MSPSQPTKPTVGMEKQQLSWYPHDPDGVDQHEQETRGESDDKTGEARFHEKANDRGHENISSV
jgi:hypothetical protein